MSACSSYVAISTDTTHAHIHTHTTCVYVDGELRGLISAADADRNFPEMTDAGATLSEPDYTEAGTRRWSYSGKMMCLRRRCNAQLVGARKAPQLTTTNTVNCEKTSSAEFAVGNRPILCKYCLTRQRIQHVIIIIRELYVNYIKLRKLYT